MRRIASQLRPPVLEDLGLAAAIDARLERFSQQTGLQVELQAGTDEVPEAEEDLLRGYAEIGRRSGCSSPLGTPLMYLAPQSSSPNQTCSASPTTRPLWHEGSA